MSMPESKTRGGIERYKKPVFEKESGLVFPKDVIEKFNGGRMCIQCSSCHGCK